MAYIGNFAEDYATLNFKFTSRTVAGIPSTLGGTPVISVYKANGVTQSVAGVTLTVDFDSVTGLNNILIDLSADAFYAIANDYQVVITAGTVNGVSVVGEVVAEFSIENRFQEVNVVNWGGAAVNALISGRVDSSVGAMAANVITAAAINAAAITAAKFAAGAIDAAAIATGAIDADSIAANAITAAKIAGSAITNAKIAGNAIQSSNLAIDVIGAPELSAGAIDKIRDGILADSVAFNGADIAAILLDTGTTLDAKINAIQGAGFVTGTDSLEAIRDRGDAAWTTGAGGNDRLLLQETTIATLASQISFTLAAGSADNDAYNNCTIVIEDVAAATQKAVGMILDYVGSTKTVTLKEALPFTIATTDKVYILAENSLKSTVANRQLDVTAAGNAGIDWGNIANSAAMVSLADTTVFKTTELGTNAVNSTTVATDAIGSSELATSAANKIRDTILSDSIAFAGANILAIITDTQDMQPKLGTPAADLAADIAAVKAETAAILVDTGTTLDTKINDIQGAGFATGTDSLEAIRDRGDAAWITGAGGSDRLLMVDTTIATLASQISFTLAGGSVDDDAYNNCTIVIEDVASAVQKAVGLVVDYVGATKTVTLKYDPAVFTMAVTDKVYILAENALKSALANRQLDVTAAGAVAVVDALTGHTPQTGDNFARLGVPAGANVSADIAAVKSDSAAILIDTADMQPKLGTPAADVSADIAAVKADTGPILADTADIQPKIGVPAADVSADIAAVKVDTAAVLVDTADMQPKLGTPVADVSADVAAVKAVTDAILVDTGTTLDGKLDSIVAAVVTAQGEPGQVAPPASASMDDKIAFLYKWARNKTEQTATERKHFNDAGSIVDHKATVADDGTKFTRGEVLTGP